MFWKRPRPDTEKQTKDQETLKEITAVVAIRCQGGCSDKQAMDRIYEILTEGKT